MFRSRMRAGDVFLLDAREAVETLRDGTGWEVGYPRDVWRLHLLPGIAATPGRPHGTSPLAVRPDHPALAARARQAMDTAPADHWTQRRHRQGRRRCAHLLQPAAHHDRRHLAGPGRPLLERHLAWVNSLPGGPGVKKVRIGQLNSFFQDIRRHGWDDTLPGTATFFPGDTPARSAEKIDPAVWPSTSWPKSSPPANLARWPDPSGRLITLILIRCGLRISSALALEFDCLCTTARTPPTCATSTHKMKREAAVPIDEELQADIIEQQCRLAAALA